jgi:hypothetical protein
VVYNVPGMGFGVEFVSLSDADLAHLARLVDEGGDTVES